MRSVWLALAVVISSSLTDAYGQHAAVTEADIERAKRSQPVITVRDIERAQKNALLPTEREVSAAAAQSAPKIDALPTPDGAKPVALHALAKGYEANAGRMAAAHGFKRGPAMLVFVSFAMPPVTLQRLVNQAARSQTRLVLRGLVNGSLRETVDQVQKLIGARQVAFQIDPQAFDRFAVTKTPTFVLVKEGAQRTPCGAGLCLPADAFVAVSGDVSLDYALEHIERSVPRFAKDARSFLKNFRE